MKSNNEVVSRVKNTLNSLHKDARISQRYVLNILRNKAEFLISQKLSDRSLQKEENIYVEIPCFALERIDVISCDIIQFRRCKSIMKSTCKLPKLIYSRLGSSLKEVTSLDSEKEFKNTTPSQYRRDKDRGESDYIYYYVKDDYLYLLDCEIEMVNLYLITMETEKVDEISTCSNNGKESCKSLWEYQFPCPNKLFEAVVSETVKEISVKLGVREDVNPNLDPTS